MLHHWIVRGMESVVFVGLCFHAVGDVILYHKPRMYHLLTLLLTTWGYGSKLLKNLVNIGQFRANIFIIHHRPNINFET